MNEERALTVIDEARLEDCWAEWDVDEPIVALWGNVRELAATRSVSLSFVWGRDWATAPLGSTVKVRVGDECVPLTLIGYRPVFTWAEPARMIYDLAPTSEDTWNQLLNAAVE